MKVGDLVESISSSGYALQRHKIGSFGIIVDVDPLRQGVDVEPSFITVNEIVIMLDSGALWYANPDAWRVINESR